MKIKIAGDPSCPACQSAKQFFDERKTKYSFMDINKSRAAMNMAQKAKADAIPIIQVCNTRRKKGGKSKSNTRCSTMIGFDPSKLKQFGFV